MKVKEVSINHMQICLIKISMPFFKIIITIIILIILEEVSKCYLVTGLVSLGLHLILKALTNFSQILN
jgi:hypothetical protein